MASDQTGGRLARWPGQRHSARIGSDALPTIVAQAGERAG